MRRRTQDPAHSQAGFTLIEVMVAFAIMSIGVLPIGLAQLSALRLSSTSSRLSQAMYLAEEQMETFRSMPWGAAFTLAAVDVDDPGNPLLPVAGPRVTGSTPSGNGPASCRKATSASGCQASARTSASTGSPLA